MKDGPKPIMRPTYTMSSGALRFEAILKRHPKVKGSGTATKGSSFRFQITPCATPPSEAPAFQFISSAWEDKKPVHQMLGDAYRQNRMATTASVRHLHSLHIVAPVFGLVWARGTVRAHVDWCGMPEGKKKPPVVYSAPYRVIDQGNNGGDGPEDIFHEWRLDRASDIVQVFFLIENIDHYTTNSFRQRITRGLERLVDSVVNKDASYVPWKRVGELAVSSNLSLKENHTISVATSSAQSTPPKPRGKGKQRQK